METAIIKDKTFEFKFSDEDVVNPGAYDYHDKVFLLHDHGFTVAVVYADNLQDAIDEAVDAGKMDHYSISEEDYEDYAVLSNNPTCFFLGNAGKLFDTDTLGAVEFVKPDISLVALINGLV